MEYKWLSAQFIHLNTVDSTNNYAANLIKTTKVANGTTILTKRQTNGRGQRGNSWQSEEDNNLLLSIIIYPQIPLTHIHYLTIFVSVALYKTISNYTKNVSIKWPNDIYVGNKKIAGILIENQLRSNSVYASIIGIGVNINQTNFSENHNACSLKSISENEYSIDEIFKKLYSNLDFYYDMLFQKNYTSLLSRYYEALLWYNKIGKFKKGENVFEATLKGIDESGKLILQENTKTITTYDIKEISFVI